MLRFQTLTVLSQIPDLAVGWRPSQCGPRCRRWCTCPTVDREGDGVDVREVADEEVLEAEEMYQLQPLRRRRLRHLCADAALALRLCADAACAANPGFLDPVGLSS